MDERDFPPPWSAEQWASCFVVSDAAGRPLAHIYFADDPERRKMAKLLARDDARQIAENIAGCPDCSSSSPPKCNRRVVWKCSRPRPQPWNYKPTLPAALSRRSLFVTLVVGTRNKPLTERAEKTYEPTETCGSPRSAVQAQKSLGVHQSTGAKF